VGSTCGIDCLAISISSATIDYRCATLFERVARSRFLDGVFVRDEKGALEFHELDEPTPDQVADVAERTAKRVIKLLEAAGKSLDSELSGDDVNDFAKRQPAIASLYAAAARGVDLSGERAGQATMRLIQKDSLGKTEPHAVVGGINIHAAVAFDARDKPRMERMCMRLASSTASRGRPSLSTGSRDARTVRYATT
jgi:hypothetical protein